VVEEKPVSLEAMEIPSDGMQQSITLALPPHSICFLK
jgi:hypothetical protein